MDKVETAVEMDFWIREAEPGDRVVYHEGYLPADRGGRAPASRKVDRLAEFAHRCGEVDRVIMRPCGHIKGVEQSYREVRLLQQKDRERDVWIYVAERL